VARDIALTHINRIGNGRQLFQVKVERDVNAYAAIEEKSRVFHQ